ncbi:hypothetical protein PGB90_004805 [Kerria lacca]
MCTGVGEPLSIFLYERNPKTDEKKKKKKKKKKKECCNLTAGTPNKQESFAVVSDKM